MPRFPWGVVWLLTACSGEAVPVDECVPEEPYGWCMDVIEQGIPCETDCIEWICTGDEGSTGAGGVAQCEYDGNPGLVSRSVAEEVAREGALSRGCTFIECEYMDSRGETRMIWKYNCLPHDCSEG